MILWTDDILALQRIVAKLGNIHGLHGSASAMPEANARPEVLAWCRETGCALTMLRVVWVQQGINHGDGHLRVQMGFADENSALAFKMRWL